MIANCTNCSMQAVFTKVENGKYKCERCGSLLHQCSGKDCINMISFGPFCSNCVGEGLKKAGAGAFAVIAAVVGGVLYFLSKGSGDDKQV